MILSKKEILKAIKAGRIKITPLEEKNIGPCSVDLRLGNKFRIFKEDQKTLKISEDITPVKHSRLIELKDKDTIKISSGELILGTTYEKITLGKDVCGRIDGRSRFARMGLLVHVSSSLVQPGTDSVQILEMINMSPFEIVLKPKISICQIVFEELRGESSYEGKFKFQKEP